MPSHKTYGTAYRKPEEPPPPNDPRGYRGPVQDTTPPKPALLIAGSRQWPGPQRRHVQHYVERVVARAQAEDMRLIVGDNPQGVDRDVVQAAHQQGVPCLVYGTSPQPRNNQVTNSPHCRYVQVQGQQVEEVQPGGRRREQQHTVRRRPVGYAERDRRMVDGADRVLCIWNGNSPGTRHVYEYAAAQDKSADLAVMREGRMQIVQRTYHPDTPTLQAEMAPTEPETMDNAQPAAPSPAPPPAPPPVLADTPTEPVERPVQAPDAPRDWGDAPTEPDIETLLAEAGLDPAALAEVEAEPALDVEAMNTLLAEDYAYDAFLAATDLPPQSALDQVLADVSQLVEVEPDTLERALATDLNFQALATDAAGSLGLTLDGELDPGLENLPYYDSDHDTALWVGVVEGLQGQDSAATCVLAVQDVMSATPSAHLAPCYSGTPQEALAVGQELADLLDDAPDLTRFFGVVEGLARAHDVHRTWPEQAGEPLPDPTAQALRQHIDNQLAGDTWGWDID